MDGSHQEGLLSPDSDQPQAVDDAGESVAAPSGTSPSSSGPAGPLFEGQVAAHYLLTMLAEAEPRGLPGVAIERVELQRAGEGHPLDDVIVRGVTKIGEPAVLEVQAKRTITFAPSDAVFKDVVRQLAHAFPTLDLSHQRHQFAVATERTSFKITGPYQDVLRWAREVDSASIFFGRINGRRVGNDDMRTFVATVRGHLGDAGCADGDETVWQVLRRFQILTFDYDSPGSQSLELALERARNVLYPTDAPRASAFWKTLTETAIRVAASGGDLDRGRLLSEIEVVDSFRMQGSRRNRATREALAEAASLAAEDIRPSIADVTLACSAQLDSARESLDHGRFTIIYGAAGVGKSGVLFMLIHQRLIEGRAIMLSPERTIPGGWLAFRSALHVDVGAEAFLSDLASDGGATLFIDSLDFFDDPAKRATVKDLVRAAASVPNFQVIATARLDFDKDEPNWLPKDALAKLGRGPPVIINELGDEQVEELRAAAPSLRALLADDHPARDMARNLFRLSRLLEVEGSTEQLRSEVDLLERWWTTADGRSDGRRDRARILADLTEAVLAGGDHVESRATPAAIDGLIGSGSLRELGLDRLAFRHDVLREWGVAARLHESPDKIGQLPLARPVPASLARGVELGARFALERSQDGLTWVNYLNGVSTGGAHASWRRWSLLAILRSERVYMLLDRASASLFENDGALLRELIRTAIAVESRPLAETLAACGVPAASIPAGIYGPSNGSWWRLARWLLARRADLPLRVLPHVVELFQSLSASALFAHPLTRDMAIALGDWLEEIEDAQDDRSYDADRPRFVRAFRRYHDLLNLAGDVRRAFLLMAASVPERAQSYLRRLMGRPRPEHVIQEVLRFRGSLAPAAPAELVDLTLAGLIPRRERRIRRLPNDVFTHLDTEFLPTSPAKGPFLELLNAAPEHGLRLIRHLVDHAIASLTNGRDPGNDGLTLQFPSGPRFFPWQDSYRWSRESPGCYAVQSALLALEAWAHSRIERDDQPEQVIADILGPEGSPAAFLLVAVDVLISHWSKTMATAIPFLGSPELLTLDRARQIHERMPEPDLIGFEAIRPEPAGPVTLAALMARPSRLNALQALLGVIAVDESADRSVLHTLLADASARLGPPQPDDTFAEPRFVVRHALNLLDPANWPFVEGVRRYVSPPEEAQHLQALQRQATPQVADWSVDTAIQIALERPERSSSEFAEQAIAYAQRLSTAADTEESESRSRTRAIVGAAVILARDGADALLDQHEAWARGIFAQAFASTEDMAASTRIDSIRFNPVAIATVGLIHLWRRRRREADRDALLGLAGRDDPYAAQGFGAGLAVIREIEPRLLPALLRCALTAQIQPLDDWDNPEEKKAASQAQYRERVSAAITAERDWLDGSAPEPSWPAFPPWMVSVRRGRGGGRVRAEQPDHRFVLQSAALWTRQLTHDSNPGDLDWIVKFVEAYDDWTAAANGAGLEPEAELDGGTDEWNSIFFLLLARAFVRLTPDQAAAYVAALIAVPDESFLDGASELVPAIDRAYFDGLGLDIDQALRLRALVADRLVQCAGWERESNQSGLSIGRRIAPAIAVLFFNFYNTLTGVSSCYLRPTPSGIDQVDPFLPKLTQLMDDGPVPFCGLLTMNLVEVSPRPAHLTFVLSSALTWLRRQPTNTLLWVDTGLGARVTRWLKSMFEADAALRNPSHPLRAQMDDVLARLVQVGVAEAHSVEALLATRTGNTAEP